VINVIHRKRKRLFDVTAASIGLVLLLPVLITVALLISLYSPEGKVYFSQLRYGRLGRPFKCLKFRSMVPNAEAVLEEMLRNDPVARAEFESDFKLRRDPRIIARIGKTLRSLSLDEFPQLINVLSGDMSFVGPRPIVLKERYKYGECFEKLVTVKPGLTGNWQVSGRNDISYDERIALDMQYIDNMSMWKDILIIAKTFGVMLRKKGAY